MSFEQLKMRAFGTPLLLRPEKAEVILSLLSDKFNGIQLESVESNPETGFSYDVTDGIATLTIHGTLVKSSSWMDAYSGLVSYEEIQSNLQAAIENDDVVEIVMDINSPGGEASGCADLSNAIAKAATLKPIHAFASGSICSAAYWIASACTDITVSQDSIVGSIGVVMALYDRLEANKAQGIKVHVFHAGAAKADGSPDTPFTGESNARIQEHIDDLYTLFVDSVATNRAMSTKDVRATEAQVYLGAKAIGKGLADKVGTLDTVLTVIGGNMTEKKQEAINLTADLDAARLEGMQAERERITEIETLTIAGREAIATQAKTEGWDVPRFLKTQTVAEQTDKQARMDAREETDKEQVPAAPVSTPEPKTTVTELTKTSSDEDIEKAFNESEDIKAEFGKLENFSALVKSYGWRKA